MSTEYRDLKELKIAVFLQYNFQYIVRNFCLLHSTYK